MQYLRARLNSCLTRAAIFAANHRGTAAIEFAVIAPLMITLYLGGVEISDAIAASRKTTLVARTVADLVAQGPMKDSSGTPVDAINNTAMTDILSAAAIVATPYGNSNLAVTVSSIKIDDAGAAKVQWSDTKNGTALVTGSSVALDPALAVPNTWLILGEATYKYVPPFGEAITGSINLTDKIYMRPRNTVPPCVKRDTSGNPSAKNC